MSTCIWVNLLISIIIYLLAIIINCMILSLKAYIEGKNGFQSNQKVSYMVLTSVFIAVQLTLSNATNDAQRLKDKQYTLSYYWNKTKIFIQLIFKDMILQWQKILWKQEILMMSQKNFIKNQKDKLKIFLINSDNYEKESDGRGNQRYEFEYAGDKEEQIYSPAGRSIQIDENYLK